MKQLRVVAKILALGLRVRFSTLLYPIHSDYLTLCGYSTLEHYSIGCARNKSEEQKSEW